MHLPTMYTTIKAEIRQDENLMGILKTRTKKACPLLREYGPVNWCASTRDAAGMPIRYNWSVTSLKAYVNESLRALCGHKNRNRTFHMVTVPAKNCLGAIGIQRAKLFSLVQRGFDKQFCYRDRYKL